MYYPPPQPDSGTALYTIPHINIRRPWSPQELEPYINHAQLLDQSEASYEEYDMMDYAATLHRPSTQEQFSNLQHPRHVAYPVTPPRSLSFAPRHSFSSPPSLCSTDISSAKSHPQSPYSPTFIPQPLSLSSHGFPVTPAASKSDHSSNEVHIYNNQSSTNGSKDDVSTFPEWSRLWFDTKKARAYDPYGTSFPNGYDGQSQSHTARSIPAHVFSVVNSSNRSILPWSENDGISEIPVSSEMKEERLRMLEKEFGSNGRQDIIGRGDSILGSVDAKGNLVTDGPKKRTATRWAQGTFLLGLAITCIYSILLLKPKGTPPPKGSVIAFLLYTLTVVTILLFLVAFLIIPCCFSGKSRSQLAYDTVPGMMVLPVQRIPGTSSNGKRKNKRGMSGPADNVQVNLIVDPAMFGRNGNNRGAGLEDEERGVDEDDDIPPRPGTNRRGLSEGLIMEEQWKRARRRVKQLLFFDVSLMYLWGAELVGLLLGKHCPVGSFDGWCDGYNVGIALTAFLAVSFGFSAFFDIRDLHMSRTSPRTRT